jgi:polysaccharide biosynthesis transport protein
MAIESALPANMEGPALNLQPMAILRRRAMPVSVVVVTALLFALLVAAFWPPTYLSTGTILIEQQEVPTELVRSTISSYADQRIQVISQRVMTTSNLLRIIQQYDLYPEERKSKGRETIIAKMRDNVKFRTISAEVIDPRQGRPTQATIAFSLGFESRSAEQAARVANELSSLYLQENLASRKQLTEEATRFLSEEAERLSRQIAEQEQKLAIFKSQNMNNLPEVAQINVQQLSRMDDARRDLDARVISIDQQMLFLNAQLQQLGDSAPMITSTGERLMSPSDRLKALRSQYAQIVGVYAENHPDVQRLKREIASLEKTTSITGADEQLLSQLADAEKALADVRQRYSVDHPDVIREERIVAGIRQALTEKAAAGKTAAVEPVKGQNDSPMYMQLSTQREAYMNERAATVARRADLANRIGALERNIGSSPGVERDYTALRRDLDGTQLKFREVQAKQLEAQVAQNLEVQRKGERFSLIEPPLVPEEPTSPNRQMIIILGVVLSLVAGLATAMLLELLDGSVRGSAAVGSLLTAPPLAVIPWFKSEADQSAERQKKLYRALGALAALIVIIILVHFFYRPLDVLWALALRRIG